MNFESYIKVIQEDIEWLEQFPDTLERKHIIDIITDSIRFYYPDETEECIKMIMWNKTDALQRNK